MQRLKEVARRTGINRLRWHRKAAIVRRYHKSPAQHLGYVFIDPELENFTYDIANRAELAAWLDSHVPGAGGYLEELDQDRALEAELAARLRWRPWVRFQPFGRRLGWYAVVRATKPSLVVETGTHDGLGSVALLAALERNAREGHPGRLISIDPRGGTGWLVPQQFHHMLTRVRATSYEALPNALDGAVPDIFIHDSLHTVECETWEFETAVAVGARILLSDNSHSTTVLQDVAARHDYEYSFWQERPQAHWYPGAGIGLAVSGKQLPAPP